MTESPASRHISPVREAKARICRQRQGGRESGRAGGLAPMSRNRGSSTLAALNAADAGSPASAAVNR